MQDIAVEPQFLFFSLQVRNLVALYDGAIGFERFQVVRQALVAALIGQMLLFRAPEIEIHRLDAVMRRLGLRRGGGKQGGAKNRETLPLMSPAFPAAVAAIVAGGYAVGQGRSLVR